MQTELHETLRDTATGRRAEQILRTCVHCGFCNATCPTYAITGDELDGPRGRIYLIKEVLESGEGNPTAQRHLDRCLTCRACETTCPSGVAYGELLEVGRGLVEESQRRGWFDRAVRGWLLAVVPRPRRFRRWARLGGWFRWLLPGRLRDALPRLMRVRLGELTSHSRKVLVLQGCVQQVATPQANAALTRLLDARGLTVVHAEHEACCGSLNLHLGEHDRALTNIRQNIDALTPHLEDVEAVISTASGCGVTIKDYPRLLENDAEYAPRAAALARKFQDAAEFVTGESLGCRKVEEFERVAWQAPCTLQHGQQITGVVERLLAGAGYVLVNVKEAHACCGSAGTYSLLQAELSAELRDRKLGALCAERPDVIATANVGCQTHLASASAVPVRHWLELLQ
ncbi:MAG: glycolate oxidase subunit GlcF [Gammaproteobacteria bacterium]|nr:glycolate oxidase subunit GlcF [Gammaproteobacteria bacterium]